LLDSTNHRIWQPLLLSGNDFENEAPRRTGEKRMLLLNTLSRTLNRMIQDEKRRADARHRLLTLGLDEARRIPIIKNAVELPPNSTGSIIGTLTSGGKEYQQVIIVDATTPTGPGSALANAANLGAKSSAGAQLITRPGDWAIGQTPAAATQATISRAAGAAGVSHVATSISVAVSTVGTAQTAALVFVLRDGATGAGTVLWTLQVSLPVNTTWSFALSSLNIVGTAATAMTLETVAAPAAAVFASVSLTGYDTPNA